MMSCMVTWTRILKVYLMVLIDFMVERAMIVFTAERVTIFLMVGQDETYSLVRAGQMVLRVLLIIMVALMVQIPSLLALVMAVLQLN